MLLLGIFYITLFHPQKCNAACTLSTSVAPSTGFGKNLNRMVMMFAFEKKALRE
jgi:hypothetical protein